MTSDVIEPFRIATLSAPGGGQIGLARLPGRAGMLEADVRIIADWPAHCAVSLTESDEMVAMGGAGLWPALEACGIAVHTFPVRDFGEPEPSAGPWPELAARLHAVLDQGRNVFIHCRGGLGRSGMVAMRLLTERGLDPQTALAHVRAARPGAVETAAQEAWASEGARAHFGDSRP